MPRNEFVSRDRGDDPENEDLNQEVDPVEDDPHQWPATTLADLRKGTGFTTTEAHIAEIKKKWNDPDHIFEL